MALPCLFLFFRSLCLFFIAFPFSFSFSSFPFLSFLRCSPTGGVGATAAVAARWQPSRGARWGTATPGCASAARGTALLARARAPCACLFPTGRAWGSWLFTRRARGHGSSGCAVAWARGVGWVPPRLCLALTPPMLGRLDVAEGLDPPWVRQLFCWRSCGGD